MSGASHKAPSIVELELFDAWSVVGRQHSRAFGRGLLADELVGLMDQYSIKEALVTHAEARCERSACQTANELLMRDTAGRPRLHPCWTLAPELDWYGQVPERAVETMLATGVRAAHLPALKQPFEVWSWRPLLRVLEAHRVPSLVDYGSSLVMSVAMHNTLDWQKLHDIAIAFPQLPLILTGFRFPRREVFLLMSYCANVYTVDFNFASPGERRPDQILPPERYLLGSGAPEWDPGLVVSVAQYTELLDQRGKKLVSGDNLRRLMGEVK